MTLRIYEDQGAAKLNEAAKVGRFKSLGPATVQATNLGNNLVVVSLEKEVGGAAILSDKDTQQTAENTGYTGNGSLLAFTGQQLNVVPIVPGTLRITPATSGVDLVDDLRDGKVYTDDIDHDVAGTVDYFTGDLTLAYPTGKAPDGQLDADYVTQDSELVALGKKSLYISNVLQDDAVVVKAACDSAEGSHVRIDAVASAV